MNTNKLIRIIVTSLSLTLTACGFKLRSTPMLPKQYTVVKIIQRDQYSEFGKQLKRSLEKSGVKIAADTQAAPITIHLLHEDFNSQRINPTDTNQLYTDSLRYSVTYRVSGQDNKSLTSTETLSSQRTQTVNSSAVLDATTAQHEIKREMQRDLMNKLMNKLTRQLS